MRRNTFFSDFLKTFEISLSKGDKPNFLSTTNKIRSAFCIASWVLKKTNSSKLPFSDGKNPPVSTKLKTLFPFFITTAFLSLVRASWFETIADLKPANLLKIVDLPTLVLPTNAKVFIAQKILRTSIDPRSSWIIKSFEITAIFFIEFNLDFEIPKISPF